MAPVNHRAILRPMPETTRSLVLPLAVLTAAQAATAALGLVEIDFSPVLAQPAMIGPVEAETILAVGLCALWALASWLRLGAFVLVTAAPALVLLPGGGWPLLAAWSLAGFTGALALHRLAAPNPETVRSLRNELRDHEHERNLLHRHIQRYPALLEACLELSAARELDQFATVLCQRARELLPEIQEVLVFLGSSTELECLAATDRDGQPCPRPAGDDELYVAAEARSLLRRQDHEVRMLIPLRGDRRQQDVGGEALRGVLAVRLVTGDFSDRLALELLDALGRLGGLGLAAVDLVNQARGLALKDDLTGLYGQHEFLRRLKEQVAACRRGKLNLGVVMCDMDHLKCFNDEFGHLAGDAALRAVAQAIGTILPPEAIACRYGGEEFAAVVPGLDAAGLAALGEALRHAIANARPDPAQPERRVTASLGVTMLRAEEEARAALKRADAACYQAKAKGRNRVEVVS